MARKSASKRSRRGVARAKRLRSAPRRASARATRAAADANRLPGIAKILTPQQAFELYRANARMALDVIDAALESTGKLRKIQFEGEAQARSVQKSAVRRAAEARDPQGLLAAGQAVTQEAVETAMRYWSQMFDLIVEMQKRLFALVEQQLGDAPGARETKAALAMLPDLGQARNLVSAMQGMMASGGSALEAARRAMGDLTGFAQQRSGETRR
jgi:phasin family protein